MHVQSQTTTGMEMTEPAALERELAQHPAHAITEPDAHYVLGRWHPRRLKFRGYVREAKAWAHAMGKPADVSQFLVFGRPRSGTTVITTLLNKVDDIRCQGELLNAPAFWPRQFITNLAIKNRKPVAGSKLLSYQLLHIQAVKRPYAFMRDFHDHGFKLIHIRRDTFAQSISLQSAQTQKLFHIRDAKAAPDAPIEVALDPARFLQTVRWNAAMLDFEERLMSAFPHEVIQYETDLATPEQQQATVDRVCDLMGIPSQKVESGMRRVGGKSGAIRITNRDDLKDLLVKEGFGHIVPKSEA